MVYYFNEGVVQLTIIVHKNTFAIGVVYQPPNVDYMYLSELDSIVENIFPVCDKILLIGDLNNEQLLIYIRKYHLIPINQSGFRSCHSSITTLSDVCDHYPRDMCKGYVTTSVMLDLSNAFGCLIHELLLAKYIYTTCLK